MSFETSFLSTSNTSRKIAAKITNVTQSTSQTLALSNAGNSYTLSSLSTSAGDTVVITFYYTDGESKGKNQVRLKQTGGSAATGTIGGIYSGGTITSFKNKALSGDPALTGLPNPSTNNTFTFSTSTLGLSSSVHEVVEVNGADPGDKYQIGFSFTVPTGITKIELQNEDDDDEAGYTTTLTFPISVTAAGSTTYEVTVARDSVNDVVTTSWSPSPTGNGTTGSRYEFEAGDIIKFKKVGSDSVSVTPSSGFFTTNGAISVGTSFISRTVATTQANYTLSYSITYVDPGSGGGGIDP